NLGESGAAEAALDDVHQMKSHLVFTLETISTEPERVPIVQNPDDQRSPCRIQEASKSLEYHQLHLRISGTGVEIGAERGLELQASGFACGEYLGQADLRNFARIVAGRLG